MSGETRVLDINPVIPVKNMEEGLAFYLGKLGFVKTFDDAASPCSARICS